MVKNEYVKFMKMFLNKVFWVMDFIVGYLFVIFGMLLGILFI